MRIMVGLSLLVTVGLSILFSGQEASSADERDFLVLTVASNQTDGFTRLQRSAKTYGLPLKALGFGQPWLGGDMNYQGGGVKINLLRKELEKYRNKKNMIIMFVDGYDVILTSGKEEIIKAFESFKTNVVFGAEDFCWPDNTLRKQYPAVIHGYKFLNSGGLIGYAPKIYDVISKPLGDTDDDQLYYTKVFLEKRDQIGIKLDTQAQIFQNLNEQTGDVSLKFGEDDTHLINSIYDTTPKVIHGNGRSKSVLNTLGNYLARSWTKNAECIACKEGLIDLTKKKESEYPRVLISVFVERPSAFLEETLQKVSDLSYPKERIDLFVHNAVPVHESLVEKWTDERKLSSYRTVKYISEKKEIKEWHAKNLAISECLELNCDLLFSVDSEYHIDNPETLKLLISYNRSIIAPVSMRIGKAWATFWGAVTDDGYYARSADYMDIINNIRRGIWNVPYINGAYVIWRRVLENPDTRPNFIYKLMDADMAFAKNLRDKNVFMYAVNLDYYGHLVNNEAVATGNLHNDLWQVAANPEDWEQRYINEQYAHAAHPKNENLQPCPDVYWIPLFTPRFCKELIETMENFGKWSGGKNEDPRISGGYENVPTVDIHMKQVNFEQEFLYILKTYVKPIAEKLFTGYTSDATATMNFVVRYRPDEQFYLRPHHDASTYTINVGLNRPNIDYQGGGANFIRYNCSVVDTKVGWALLHPGRLTHYHEGLPTTNGTRYILVSFIDP